MLVSTFFVLTFCPNSKIYFLLFSDGKNLLVLLNKKLSLSSFPDLSCALPCACPVLLAPASFVYRKNRWILSTEKIAGQTLLKFRFTSFVTVCLTTDNSSEKKPLIFMKHIKMKPFDHLCDT